MGTRRLTGVQLKKVIGTVFQSAGWQRCRLHFVRNVLAVAPTGSQEMGASIMRITSWASAACDDYCSSKSTRVTCPIEA